MQLLYLPLDERPCNYDYPPAIARLQPGLSLHLPPRDLLSAKKQPGDRESLWAWLQATIPTCQGAILSLDMLVYGGLLPSRLHQEAESSLLARLERLGALRAAQPALTLFASSLILRTPAYNSSEEEPDYYADYGAAIHRWGWLADRRERQGLGESEAAEWAQVQSQVPETILADYRHRRQRNLAVNQRAIALVAQGVIDFLCIPQDDCAPYGFAARDQQQVLAAIARQRLQSRIHLYPGADEVGCTLLARAYNQTLPQRPRFYPCYSSAQGAHLTPLYEDRPISASVPAQIFAAGGQVVATPEAADIVLAVNTPGSVMQEAWDNPHKDITYSSQRNLRVFLDQVATALAAGRPVAIADVAFANGGETELVELLDEAALWEPLLAYAGWNTCGNSLGTAIATASLGLHHPVSTALTANKIARILEDWAYQTVVRQTLQQDFLPRLGASYYDFNGQAAAIHAEIAQRLRALWHETLRHSFRTELGSLQVSCPWQRLFEIDLRVRLSGSSP